MSALTLEGKDNYGRPRQEFAEKLAAMTDDEYVVKAEECIWLSAFASNDPRSDYHWQADACHDEAGRRGNGDLYRRAWRNASRYA